MSEAEALVPLRGSFVPEVNEESDIGEVGRRFGTIRCKHLVSDDPFVMPGGVTTFDTITTTTLISNIVSTASLLVNGDPVIPVSTPVLLTTATPFITGGRVVTAGDNVTLTDDGPGGNFTISVESGSGLGTVTSVGVAVPAEFVSTGGPITTSGTITIGYATGQAANKVLATPDGATGALALRSLVAADIPFPPPQSASNGTYLISGGGVSLVSGYQFQVSPAVYSIAGVILSSLLQTVTLGAVDATLDRIDIIALDNTGTAIVIAGTLSATPVAPDVDPSTQLELTFVYVTHATSTAPVTRTFIYRENTEWTGTTSGGTIVLASTSNPYAGTKDVEATAAITGNFVYFDNGSTLSLTPYAQLVFHIRLKAAFDSTRSLTIAFQGTGGAGRGTTVLLRNGSFGFSGTLTGAYQTIVIPLSAFAIPTGQTVQRLRFNVTGTGTSLGFYLDDIDIEGGLATVPALPLLFRGAWDSGTAYITDDIVTYINQTWMAVQPTTNNAPAAGSAYWSALTRPVFVASGASHAVGLVPDPGSSSGTTKFLREDATFAVPPSTNVVIPATNNYRLTLTSGLAVTSADVTGATTIYWTPDKGDHVSSYTGSVWQDSQPGELSLALGTLTSGKPYDVFLVNTAGVLTLQQQGWSNATTRGFNLVTQDNILVLSGSTNYRYLGTFYTTSTTTTADSAANRALYNYYNQRLRSMTLTDAGSHAGNASVREWNGGTALRVTFMLGQPEFVRADANARVVGGATVQFQLYIGLDTSAGWFALVGLRTPALGDVAASFTDAGTVSVGQHYLTIYENGPANGTALAGAHTVTIPS